MTRPGPVTVLARSTTFHAGGGGMEGITRSLMEGLVSRGLDVTCVTTAHPEGRLEESAGGVSYHFLPGSPSGRITGEWLAESVAWMDTVGTVSPPRVLLSQSGSARGYVQHRRSTAGIPVVAMMHGLTPWNLRMAALDLRFPRGYVTWVKLLLRCAYERWIEPAATRRYDRMLALGPRMAEDLSRHLSYDRSLIEIVPNFIDLEHFRPPLDGASRASQRERLGIPPGAPLVLMISRLVRTKGMACGLEALRLAAGDVHMAIAGEGSEEEALKRIARDLGVDSRVRFLGRVPPSDLPSFYGAGDLLLFPSWFPEGQPMVVIEGMAAGLPVIATPVGEVASAIDEGDNGHLVPFQDAAAIARRIDELMKDPERRQAMGRRGRERAEARFDRERVIDRHLEILEAITGGRS